MSKKNKITGALVCTGLALSLLGGGSAVIPSVDSSEAATASATEIIRPQSDETAGQITVSLQEEFGRLSKYNGLVNGFYESIEYIELKTELDALIFKLAALDKNSAEYNRITEKINCIWGKISILAGEANSQIILVHPYVADNSPKSEALMQQKKEAVNMQLAPVAEQLETKTIKYSLMLELEMLRQILGI